MGSIQSKVLVTRARRLLQDESNVSQRWTDTVLLDCLNEGQLALVLLRPNASATTKKTVLVAGTHQKIPDNGIQFLRLMRNISAAGAPGRAITVVGLDVFDLGSPSWHASTGSATIYQYASDPVELTKYYVSPPAAAGTKVEVSYSVTPEKIYSINTPISLDDQFAPALVDYIVYRALSQDDDDDTNLRRSQIHYNYFANQVMGKPAFAPPRQSGGQQ